MALRHDVPQRDIGGGIGGEAGVGRSHAGPTVAAGRSRATAKNDSLMKVLLQPAGLRLRRPLPAISAGRPMQLAGVPRGRFRWRPRAGLP